jgi:DNA repair protein RadD
MFEKRQYQQDAIKLVAEHYQRGRRRVLLVSPTGTGKTATACQFVSLVLAKNNSAVFVTHRLKLMSQTSNSFNRSEINFTDTLPAKIWQGGKAHVAMAQTLSKRQEAGLLPVLPRTALAIVDEAHRQDADALFPAASPAALFSQCFVLGLTATPFRQGKQRQLALNYDALVIAISISDAITQGWIVNCMMHAVNAAQASVFIGRDYTDSESFRAMNNAKCYDGALEAWQREANREKTIAFCSNVQHAITMCLKFAEAGIRAKYVVSPVTPPKPPAIGNKAEEAVFAERLKAKALYDSTYMQYSGKQEDMFNSLADGRCDVLFNAGIAVEGVDVPAVSCVLIARLCNSVSRWIQMLGRGARAAENKTHFIAIYMGSNGYDLGAFAMEREFSLWHSTGKSGGGAPPLTMCGHDSKGRPIDKDKPGCGRLIPASLKVCPYPDCGHIKKAKVLKKAEVALVGGDGKSVNDMTISELKNYWKASKQSTAWLWRQLWLRGGVNELTDFAKRENWSAGTLRTASNWCYRVFAGAR